jgi:hypothetical protein
MGFLKGFKDSRIVMAAMPHVAEFMPRPTFPGGGVAPTEDELAPIETVTLERYATIVRGIAACNYDQSVLPRIAAQHGIDTDTWRRVHDGWNARIQSNTAVARRFSDLYHS